MKLSFFILFFLFTSIIVSSQEPADGIFPLKDGAIYYEKIATIDSLSKDDLYKGVKSWGVNNFKSQKDVLQADDRETGFIAYKGFFEISFQAPSAMGIKPYAYNWQYWLTMKVFLKDNKVKITIGDIYLKETQITTTTSILTFKGDTEDALKRGMAGKGYREKYYVETKNNFQRANIQMSSMIDDLISKLKSGKSEFDF